MPQIPFLAKAVAAKASNAQRDEAERDGAPAAGSRRSRRLDYSHRRPRHTARSAYPVKNYSSVRLLVTGGYIRKAEMRIISDSSYANAQEGRRLLPATALA